MSPNCVAALLHFMGKSVSHHCVLIGCQILAELCVNVCAGNRRCLLQRAVQAERKGYDRLRAPTVEAASCFNYLATVWTRFLPFFLFCAGGGALPSWFLKSGGSRCGLASGVSGSSEQQGYMPWAACSPSQRIGEMLLKGQ